MARWSWLSVTRWLNKLYASVVHSSSEDNIYIATQTPTSDSDNTLSTSSSTAYHKVPHCILFYYLHLIYTSSSETYLFYISIPPLVQRSQVRLCLIRLPQCPLIVPLMSADHITSSWEESPFQGQMSNILENQEWVTPGTVWTRATAIAHSSAAL